jgi:hypothetical protein
METASRKRTKSIMGSERYVIISEERDWWQMWANHQQGWVGLSACCLGIPCSTRVCSSCWRALNIRQAKLLRLLRSKE